MIINIRGTSGSGKSTLVQWVLAQYECRVPVFIEKRKRPLYYRMWHTHSDRAVGKPAALVVLGHYEVACGGCDTLPTMDVVFGLVEDLHTEGTDVLFEGLLLGVDVTRTAALARLFGPDQLDVIFLDTPLETCIASINKRRWAKNPAKPPVDPKNTESKLNALKGIIARLSAEGVHAVSLSRDDARTHIGGILFGGVDKALL